MSSVAATITEIATTIVDVSISSTQDRTLASTTEQYKSKGDSKASYTDGTGTSQIKRTYVDQRTLTMASGTDDLNLSNLTDPKYGTNINFDKVRFIYIKNLEPVDSDGANLLISPSPSNGWVTLFNSVALGSGKPILLGPQDEFYLSSKQAGIDCPTSASVLRITHDGGSTGALDYIIAIGGTI